MVDHFAFRLVRFSRLCYLKVWNEYALTQVWKELIRWGLPSSCFGFWMHMGTPTYVICVCVFVWGKVGKQTEFILIKWHVSAVLGPFFFFSQRSRLILKSSNHKCLGSYWHTMKRNARIDIGLWVVPQTWKELLNCLYCKRNLISRYFSIFTEKEKPSDTETESPVWFGHQNILNLSV